MERFRNRYPDDERASFFVGTVSYVAQTAQRTTHRERLQALDTAQSDFEMHRARLKDMVDAALSHGNIESLRVAATESGFQSIDSLLLYAEDQDLAGWQIHMT
jgi:hypothetical protein